MKTLLLSLILSSGLAFADPFLVFSNPNQIGTPGGTLSFDVTLTNPGGGSTVFLNSDSLNIDSPLILNDLFFANSPATLPSPGTATFTAFTVTIPGVIAPGMYLGNYAVLGGATDQDQQTLGSANFSVTIAAASVPEPSSVMLLMPLLLGVAWRLKARPSAA